MTPREFVDLHWAAPQLKVLDAAIHMLESRRRDMCCPALTAAVRKFAPRPDDGPDVCAVATLYRAQFGEFSFRRAGGGMPWWWNSPDFEGARGARLAALRAFRAACIEAGGAA